MPPILLVEDDREMQHLVRSLLELEGLAVEVTGDGKSARAWLTEHRPSLVLLDWTLPDTDGADVAEHIRSIHGEQVPILLLTADGSAVAKAARVGARGSIAKPFSIDLLMAAVRQALEAE